MPDGGQKYMKEYMIQSSRCTIGARSAAVYRYGAWWYWAQFAKYAPYVRFEAGPGLGVGVGVGGVGVGGVGGAGPGGAGGLGGAGGVGGGLGVSPQNVSTSASVQLALASSVRCSMS